MHDGVYVPIKVIRVTGDIVFEKKVTRRSSIILIAIYPSIDTICIVARVRIRALTIEVILTYNILKVYAVLNISTGH